MKRLYKIALSLSLAALGFACSGEKEPGEVQLVEVKGLQVKLGERDGTVESRNPIAGFAVNRAGEDPTHDGSRLVGTYNWVLDVKAYDHAGDPYTPGTATVTYSGGYWTPSSNFYIPNYLMIRMDAILYPPTADPLTHVPALDQSDATKLLNQDLLVQNGPSYTATPAHIMSLQLRHKYSMLDFILDGVDQDDIQSVNVKVGSATYDPCKLSVTGDISEYMVILPVGTMRPQIVVKTKAGAVYEETLRIESTAINHCYCIKFRGVELVLSSVTVIDWAYGSALSGQYTTPTSYPTFQGNAGQTTTLYYDNGQNQEITFDQRGEITTKPLGRNVVRIGENILTTPLILDRMYIDLTSYL